MYQDTYGRQRGAKAGLGRAEGQHEERQASCCRKAAPAPPRSSRRTPRTCRSSAPPPPRRAPPSSELAAPAVGARRAAAGCAEAQWYQARTARPPAARVRALRNSLQVCEGGGGSQRKISARFTRDGSANKWARDMASLGSIYLRNPRQSRWTSAHPRAARVGCQLVVEDVDLRVVPAAVRVSVRASVRVQVRVRV